MQRKQFRSRRAFIDVLTKTRCSEAGEHGQVQCRPHPPACFSTVSQGLPFKEKESLLELISSNLLTRIKRKSKTKKL